MIEVMACALWEADWGSDIWEKVTEPVHDIYRKRAIAMVKAQRQWLLNQHAPNQGESMDPNIIEMLLLLQNAIDEATILILIRQGD